MVVIREGLTYDDVLLVPKRSSILSRDDVSTAAQLTKKIMLNIPVLSANMDTVTEAPMAIAIAREGGMGIIHRFLSVEEQVAHVQRVKRSESILIEQPYTLTTAATVLDAQKIMDAKGVSGILIVEHNALKGILTRKDLLFESDTTRSVRDVMTKDLITALYGIDIADAKKLLIQHKIEKLPLVDGEGFLRGLLTAKDLLKRDINTLAAKDKKGKLLVGAAVGTRPGYVDRADALVNAGVDVLVIDIAHGHSDQVIDAVRTLKGSFSVDVIAGNVATAEGTIDLIKAGADAVKVGVGGGSICITRIITGSGVPQFTAVMDSAAAAKEYGIPFIADQAIKNSGDLTKALAAGASVAMCGSLFAGTEESPGIAITRDGKKFKFYRGMASLDANVGRQTREQEAAQKTADKIVPEGVESRVPYRGTVKEVCTQLIGGLKSGMSYCGARTIAELHKNAEFIRMTNMGLRESHAHDVDVIK